jgi:hypothetical protein
MTASLDEQPHSNFWNTFFSTTRIDYSQVFPMCQFGALSEPLAWKGTMNPKLWSARCSVTAQQQNFLYWRKYSVCYSFAKALAKAEM